MVSSDSHDARGVDFAILTALEIERVEVCASFGLTDEHRVKKGGRVYWHGQFPLENDVYYSIVVAQPSDMGQVEAALLTVDVIHKWSPSAILFVGIAASTDKDVAMGDVVVGRSVYYYEHGKVTPVATRPQPEMMVADAVLLAAAIALPQWHMAPSAERPGHDETMPRLHFGVIASGEKVIADTRTRDSIAAGHRKIVAIEMEGYGFSRAVWQSVERVRHLSIRGICDDGSPSKDDSWHRYAAAAAAAFTRHLLQDRPLKPKHNESLPEATKPSTIMPPPSSRRRTPSALRARKGQSQIDLRVALTFSVTGVIAGFSLEVTQASTFVVLVILIVLATLLVLWALKGFLTAAALAKTAAGSISAGAAHTGTAVAAGTLVGPWGILYPVVVTLLSSATLATGTTLGAAQLTATALGRRSLWSEVLAYDSDEDVITPETNLTVIHMSPVLVLSPSTSSSSIHSPPTAQPTTTAAPSVSVRSVSVPIPSVTRPPRVARVNFRANYMYASLRDGPSRFARRLSAVPKGAEVTLLGPSLLDKGSDGGVWYRVSIGGTVGWLHANTLEEE